MKNILLLCGALFRVIRIPFEKQRGRVILEQIERMEENKIVISRGCERVCVKVCV